VVGDLLIFNIGDMFTVDGLIIQGSEVRVDESSVTGESDEIKKIPFEDIRSAQSKPNRESQ
jgi:Ca2+ transporting ATPase